MVISTPKTLELAGDEVDEKDILTALNASLGLDLKPVQLHKADLAAKNVLFGELIDMFTNTEFPEINFEALRNMNPRLRTFSAWLKELGKEKFERKSND